MIKTFASTVAVAGILFTGNAIAQSTPGEETFFELNKALAASQRCSGVELSQDQHNSMQAHIAEAAGEPIGAGRRLELILQAKQRIQKLAVTKGCSQAEVAESVARYESDLAGLL